MFQDYLTFLEFSRRNSSKPFQFFPVNENKNKCSFKFWSILWGKQVQTFNIVLVDIYSALKKMTGLFSTVFKNEKHNNPVYQCSIHTVVKQSTYLKRKSFSHLCHSMLFKLKKLFFPQKPFFQSFLYNDWVIVDSISLLI